MMFGVFGNRKEITVTVTAYGLAARLLRPGRYPLKEGSTVRALLKKAGVSNLSVPLVFMIEGERVDPARILADGETVKVFQMAGGG